jgi:hypothetical protein
MADTVEVVQGTATVVEAAGATGPQGPAGAAGQGVPVGGSTGQVLRKVSGTNYDTEWAAAASGSAPQADDYEVTDSTKGIILKSSNNTRWRVTIDNNGSLLRTALATLILSALMLCGARAQVRDLVYGTNNVVVGPTNGIALSFTNSVAFSNPINVGGDMLISNNSVFFGNVSIDFEEAQLELLGNSVLAWGNVELFASVPLAFNNTSNAATTRTNLGLGATNVVRFGEIQLYQDGEQSNSITYTIDALNFNANGSTFLSLDSTTGGTVLFYRDIAFGEGTNSALNAAQTRTNLGLGSLATNNSVPSGAATTNSLLRADGAGGSAFVATLPSLTIGVGTNTDITLQRETNNALSQRNGTNPQTLFLFNTYSNSTNYERGFLKWNTNNVFQIGTEKGSAGGTARGLEFQTDATTRFTISSAGLIGLGSSSSSSGLGASGLYVNTGAAQISMGSYLSSVQAYNQRVEIYGDNAAGTATVLMLSCGKDLVRFGGTTTNFPSLKRTNTVLQVRLADDSAFTTIDAQLRAQGTAPTNSTATGTAGDIRYDTNNFLYICVSSNTWRRTALTNW